MRCRVCASGLCATVDVEGLMNLGICAVCESDADCDPGQTCQETVVDIEAGVTTPASCVV